MNRASERVVKVIRDERMEKMRYYARGVSPQ